MVKSTTGRKPTKKIAKKPGGKFKAKSSESSFKNKSRQKGFQKKHFKDKKKLKIAKSKEIQDKENVVENKKTKADGAKQLKRKSSNENEQNDEKKKKPKKPEVISRLMEVYELLRRKKSTKEEKTKLIEEVLSLTKTNQSQIIFKHDAVRVVEMCVKYGTVKQREEFFKLFKENTIALVTSKYGKFLVEKLLEYGTKDQKKIIIESFFGKVKRLIKMKGAASIVDDIYDKYANAAQRAWLVEEFYGPEFAIFKVASGRSIEEIIEKEPAKKKTIIKYMKDTLSTLCQKEVLRHSIVHRALYDFFKFCDVKDKTEMVEVLKEGLVHILHTKEGAKVAMNCLWHGSTKDRKLIIKSFKTLVLKICKEEYGHWVLLALFDVIDDTVLVKKAIFPELLSNIKELMLDQYGRKVLLYLLKPRSSSYFIPELQTLLKQGDNNPYSKKEASLRQQELREPILPNILKAMVEPLKDILKNKSVAILLLAALEVTSDGEEAEELMRTIINLIKKPLKFLEDSEDDDKQVDPTKNMICDPCAHWVIKKIIQQDKKRSELGKELLFSKLLCEELSDGTLSDWCSTNRGAFVVVSLLETGLEDVVTYVKNDLKYLEKHDMDKKKSKGVEVLFKFLNT